MSTRLREPAVLVEQVLQGDRRAMGRAISLIENRDPVAEELARGLFPHSGRALRVGITGPPGVGKSSLISALISEVRAEGKSVGVVSVDPSSPYTKGALLGDRIRLSEHFNDPGVFIRSMGSRGHLGGLAEATIQAVLVLDAAGTDLVFIETVGVGQSEIEIVTTSDVVVLVLMPGSGDWVQALKAGVMEIPDVIVVNKKDHPQAEDMVDDICAALALQQMTSLRLRHDLPDLPGNETGPAPASPRPSVSWTPPVVATEARSGEGVSELWGHVQAYLAWAKEQGEFDRRRRRQLKEQVFALAIQRMAERMRIEAQSNPEFAAILEKVTQRELDPLTAVRDVLERVFMVRGAVS